jgi:hypothetical protein
MPSESKEKLPIAVSMQPKHISPSLTYGIVRETVEIKNAPFRRRILLVGALVIVFFWFCQR